jgi:hypothetical protein
LGLHNQVVDREVISLGDSQWHSIRDFRRDSPTERPDAGNSDDGTRQDIREHDTATHCIHEFSPSSECFSSAAEPQHLYICRVKSLGSLQRFKLSSTFCIEALQNHAHLIQIALSINQGIHPGKSGFFPINSRARHRHYAADRLSAVPDCGSREYTIMWIDFGRQRHRARGFTFQSTPQSFVWVCWQAQQCQALAYGRSYVHFSPFFSARQLRKRGRLFESAG